MSAKRFVDRLMVFVGVVGLNVGGADAAPIQVSNPSFESPVVSSGSATSDVPGWIASAGSISTRRPVAGDVKQVNGSFVVENSSVLATQGSQVIKLAAGTDAYIPLTGYTLAPG